MAFYFFLLWEWENTIFLQQSFNPSTVKSFISFFPPFSRKTDGVHHSVWATPALPLLLRRENPRAQTLSLSPPTPLFLPLPSISTQPGWEDESRHPKKVVVLQAENVWCSTDTDLLFWGFFLSFFFFFLTILSSVATNIYIYIIFCFKL